MSKYTIVNAAIAQIVGEGETAGWDRSEMLLATIVSAVNEYKGAAGKKAAHDALVYELGELTGTIDTQLIRSR